MVSTDPNMPVFQGWNLSSGFLLTSISFIHRLGRIMMSASKKKTTAKRTARKKITRKKVIGKSAAGKKATGKKVTGKAAAGKKAARKKVNRKKAVKVKKTSIRKVAKKTKKTTSPDRSLINIGPQERWKLVAISAYLRAEKRGFAPGGELQDWIDAEKEIDKLMFE